MIPATIDGNKVTSIAGSTFEHNTYIEDVIISSGITSIGGMAFWNCPNLKSVTIPDSVMSIGESAFWECISLESVELSKSLTTIEASTFSQCYSLKNITIPDGVVSIKYGAFFSCKSLSSITIPDSISSLEDRSFGSCTSLTEIIVGANNPVYTSENGIVYNKDKTELVIYPGGKTADFTVPDNVTKIADYAFFGCSNLNNIIIPDSVLSIGNYAFDFCESLQDIVLPKHLQSIGEEAFGGCNNFKNVTIPDSVIQIEDGVFANCENLQKITLPKGVTTIGKEMFYGCFSLDNVIIPDSVTSIEDYAFSDCTNLRVLMLPENITFIGEDAFHGCTMLNDIYYIGSKTMWKRIDISSGNKALKQAPVQYDAAFMINMAEKYITYTGKVKKPKVIVIDKEGNIVNPSTYTVKYKKNKKIGMASVTITGNGMDVHTAHFTIRPKKTNIVKLLSKKKGFLVKWKKQKKQTDGYEIQYGVSKNFTYGVTSILIKSNKKDSTTVKKLLASGTKYNVRVRTYKTIKVGGKKQKIYSEWSSVKRVKAKK